MFFCIACESVGSQILSHKTVITSAGEQLTCIVFFYCLFNWNIDDVVYMLKTDQHMWKSTLIRKICCVYLYMIFGRGAYLFFWKHLCVFCFRKSWIDSSRSKSSFIGIYSAFAVSAVATEYCKTLKFWVTRGLNYLRYVKAIHILCYGSHVKSWLQLEGFTWKNLMLPEIMCCQKCLKQTTV